MKKKKDQPDPKKLLEFNNLQKAKVDAIVADFVKPGNPGENFKPLFNLLLTKLELPEHIKKQLHSLNPDSARYLTLLRSGRYSLLPSFFKLIQALQEARREFTIVLRSFGTDLEDAMAELDVYFALTN